MDVERTSANSIRIRWERPLITGRDDYYYNIHYSDPDQPGTFIQHNRYPLVQNSHVVEYNVSGLSSLTNYTIRVTVLNGVSEQDRGGEERRRCDVNATTGDIRMIGLTNVQLRDSSSYVDHPQYFSCSYSTVLIRAILC